MKKFLNKKIIIICSIVIFITILILSNINLNKEEIKDDLAIVNTTTKEIKKEETFFIDIKGSVKSPGVYEMHQNDRVIDAIKIAGGLTKNANTDNINLSQKLHSEMVIYVYSDNEIKNNNKLSCDTVCKTNVIEVNNCVNNENKNLININTANIDELTTLNGIGASKAQSIIEYREQNGLFKTIEEIKNVSGIQDSTFDKIKDMITV